MTRDEILTMPQIPEAEIALLWRSGYWDGVLSGMLRYRGKKYWFVCFEEASDLVEYDDDKELTASEQLGWYRKFAVIELTQEQMAEAEYWHGLFEKYVGIHTNYGIATQNAPKYTYQGIPCAAGMVDPNKYFGLYYKLAEHSDKNKTYFGIDDGRVIGWFSQ